MTIWRCVYPWNNGDCPVPFSITIFYYQSFTGLLEDCSYQLYSSWIVKRTWKIATVKNSTYQSTVWCLTRTVRFLIHLEDLKTLRTWGSTHTVCPPNDSGFWWVILGDLNRCTRWAPTSYHWSYNLLYSLPPLWMGNCGYKLYSWSYGVLTPFIPGRDPSCTTSVGMLPKPL